MTTIIVADVDGTLVDADGVLFQGVKSLMDVARKPGVAMALASARPPWSLRSLAAQLGPEVTCLSAFQGALVECLAEGTGGGSAAQWRAIRTVPISRRDLVALEARLGDGWPLWWYTARAWYVSHCDAAARSEAEIVGFPWTGVRTRPPNEPVLKALIVTTGVETAVRDALPADGGVQMVVSKPSYHEIVSDRAGAAKGLECIRGSDAAIDLVVAIGDGVNDIGMLRAADIAFTFADAPAAVRASVTSILPATRERAYEAMRRELLRIL